MTVSSVCCFNLSLVWFKYVSMCVDISVCTEHWYTVLVEICRHTSKTSRKTCHLTLHYLTLRVLADFMFKLSDAYFTRKENIVVKHYT